MPPETEITSLKERVRHLEAALNQNNPTLHATFQLPKHLENLLGLLISVPNVTPEMIVDTRVASNARVAVHRLRTALKPFDIPIKSRRALGWWIDPETKSKIQGLLVTCATCKNASPATCEACVGEVLITV